MPVPMRTTFNKAEAKYNVTTEFPNLGLHAAAATGNVGLVEYALNNGQPINSVLDGVLPLHAACAGGNVQVVKLLIDHGADVNAPRLPRKYSSDKNRDSSAPIVGTSGSTPLHFAAANGNTEVVSLLLLHGAHADRADKHGVTPEMLAKQDGWVECAKVLREWIINKDRDLREREGYSGYPGLPSLPTSSAPLSADVTTLSSSLPRRRLHMKQSIDTALNMLKATDPHAKSSHTSTPPSPPHKSFGEYTFYPVDASKTLPIDPGPRRPSLPHILQPSTDTYRLQTPSSTTLPYENVKQRRPRSAGADAEQIPDETASSVGRNGRKLGPKYSLMNIFKKAQTCEGDISSSLPDISLHLVQNGTEGVVSASSGNVTSKPLYTVSSLAMDEVHHALKGSPNHPISPKSISLFEHTLDSDIEPLPSSKGPVAVELHLALAQQQQQTRLKSKAHSNTDHIVNNSDNKPSTPLTKFNTFFKSNHNRDRSSSSGSMPIDTDVIIHDENGKVSPKLGVLRKNNLQLSKTLRFDSFTDNPTSEQNGKDDGMRNSIKSYNSVESFSNPQPITHNQSEVVHPTETYRTPEMYEEEPDDNLMQAGENSEYGNVLSQANVPSLFLHNGRSFPSSSESLSPSNDAAPKPSLSVVNAEFPFSINRTLSLDTDNRDGGRSPSHTHLNVPVTSDTRSRGDSLSSNSTFDSNLMTNSSGTSGSGTSVTVATPGISSVLTLPQNSFKASDKAVSRDLLVDNGEILEESASWSTSLLGLNERRAHAPLDIDISSISSHAQAEALVQRTRQEVLDVADAQELSSLNVGVGRSPLSASLAAYGESLALERKLREMEKAASPQKDHQNDSKANAQSGSIILPLRSFGDREQSTQKSRDGVERQLSLENRAGPPRYKRRGKDPRRPSTAEGLSTRQPDMFFTERSLSLQTSRSASVSNPNYPTTKEKISVDKSPSHGSYKTGVPPDIILEQSLNAEQFQEMARATVLDGSLSRVTSVEDADTETNTVPNFHRVSTSPVSSTRLQGRSANKLTRMGYPVADQAAAASRTSSTPSTPPTTKRFGLKSLMQTFKGKT